MASTVKAEKHVALIASNVNWNSPVDDKFLAVEKVTPWQGVIVGSDLSSTMWGTEMVRRCKVDWLGVHVSGHGHLGGYLLQPDRLEGLRDSINNSVGLAKVTNHVKHLLFNLVL
jgi:hypothetical protein